MKFKAGLFVGYNGEGYCGLQLNKDLNTIEKAIGDCLTKVGAISETNSRDYSKIHLCSSSRTDKGVHAVVNLVVAKVQKEITEELQKELTVCLGEKGIHLYKIMRLTKGFVPSKQTAFRTYEYVIPTYFLQKGDLEKEKEFNETMSSASIIESTNTTETDNKRLKTRIYSEKDIIKIIGYKSSEENIEIFKSIVLSFEGTRFYHNYTVLSNPKGKQRFIQKVTISDPYVVDEVEYIKIILEGQSFLLHQIRKMTYFALLLTRYKRDNWLDVFENSFKPTQVHIPKGPSEYLLLDNPHFMDVKDKGKMIGDLFVDEIERLAFKEKVEKLIHRRENLYRFLACLDSTRWYSSEMPYLSNKK